METINIPFFGSPLWQIFIIGSDQERPLRKKAYGANDFEEFFYLSAPLYLAGCFLGENFSR